MAESNFIVSTKYNTHSNRAHVHCLKDVYMRFTAVNYGPFFLVYELEVRAVCTLLSKVFTSKVQSRVGWAY